MRNHNRGYGWNNEVSIFYDDLKEKLLETHEAPELRAYIDGSLQEVSYIEDFIKGPGPLRFLM